MKLLATILVLASCVRLPHVDPLPRLPSDADRAAVQIDSNCSEADPFDGSRSIDWGSHTGTGVVISERHILTAAHVVACPTIPTVHVQLSDGRIVRADVELEDDATDVARLEMASADNFGLGVAPPIFATRGYEACAVAAGHKSCGHLGVPVDGVGTLEAHTGPGWSGAAVYNFQGELLGLVTAGDLRTTRFVFVGVEWMKGIP